MPEDRQPRVYGYGRASTKKQEDSPDVQKEKIRGYANLHSLGDVTFFVDPATSGKTHIEDREGGRALFGRLKPGDHIIIAKLDRAFRKLADCVIVLEKLERMVVKLHVVNLLGGAIDLSSPMGRFLIHILAAFAELERAFISERTKDGLANKKRNGVAHTNYAGYGFRWEKVREGNKVVKVKVRDDEERKVMASIVQWRMSEPPVGWDEIRRHLNFNLKLKTKDGTEFTTERIRRMCKAELELQLREQRSRNAP
jgi:DNA invertase Pin-like site-specific DNA recombinase